MKKKLGVETALIEGDRGEFTVWVGPNQVASKRGDEYPSEAEIVDAVRAAMKKASA